MIVFLDFEASSLNKKSFPIEVAWVFENGFEASRLIRPAPDWLDWSEDAERIHGISRLRLQQEGVCVEDVATLMMDQLSGHDLYTSAPSWDGKWLSILLRAAGRPRHALRLKKSDHAFLRRAQAEAKGMIGEPELLELVEGVISETEQTPPAHRALADARLERERLERVLDKVRAYVASA